MSYCEFNDSRSNLGEIKMMDNTRAERQWLGVFKYILSVCIEILLFISRNHDYRSNNGKNRIVNLQNNHFVYALYQEAIQ